MASLYERLGGLDAITAVVDSSWAAAQAITGSTECSSELMSRGSRRCSRRHPRHDGAILRCASSLS